MSNYTEPSASDVPSSREEGVEEAALDILDAADCLEALLNRVAGERIAGARGEQLLRTATRSDFAAIEKAARALLSACKAHTQLERALNMR